jgi:hypothetical protein
MNSMQSVASQWGGRRLCARYRILNLKTANALTLIALSLIFCFSPSYCFSAPAGASITGGYNFTFYNSGQNQWMTVVTSTENITLFCTISWNGFDVSKGQPAGGNRGILVPASPGGGVAEIGKYQFSGLTNFSATAICAPH